MICNRFIYIDTPSFFFLVERSFLLPSFLYGKKYLIYALLRPVFSDSISAQLLTLEPTQMWSIWRYARDNRLLCIIIPSMIVSVHVMMFNRKESEHRHFEDLQPFTYAVSCSKLFEGDPDEHKRALALLTGAKTARVIADKHYRISHNQCHAYRSERFNESFHREDTLTNQQFPLAYSILMYDNVEQFERLLRLIYRPQNFYCIHIDSDAPIDVQQGARSIVKCFDNVFLATKQEDVFYGTFSRVQADLNCMQDLIRYPSWKYLLNMANSELPLKSNSELVKILSIYRGYNDIEGNWKSRNTERTKYVWEFINTSNGTHAARLRMTERTKSPPPGNMDIAKGSAYGRSTVFLRYTYIPHRWMSLRCFFSCFHRVCSNQLCGEAIDGLV